MPVACGAEQLLRKPILLAGQPIVLTLGHPVPPAQRARARRRGPLVRCERQLEGVGADVVGLELDCHPQPVAPSGERLPRDAVDEVDAHVVEAGRACRRERLARLARRVPAGEGLEVLVTQRLDAQADPRHAGRAEAFPVGPLPLARIRLDGHLLDGHAAPIGRWPPR